MKNKTTSEIITTLIWARCSNSCSKRTLKTLFDCADELVRRDILTEEDADYIKYER